MEVFQGTVIKTVVGPKAIKVTLQGYPTETFLYFKEDDSFQTATEHPSYSTVPCFKEKHVPLFLKGTLLKVSCIPYESSKVIKGLTVCPPSQDNTSIWLQELVQHLTKLTSKSKTSEKDSDCTKFKSLKELGQFFGQHALDLRQLMRKALAADDSRKNILQVFHHVAKNTAFPDRFAIALDHVLQFIGAVYDHLGLFHQLKKDVLTHHFEDRVTDQDVLKVLKFAPVYNKFIKNPYNACRRRKHARLAFHVLDAFATMYDVPLLTRVLHHAKHHFNQILQQEGHTCVLVDMLVDLTSKKFPSLSLSDIRKVILDHPDTFTVTEDGWVSLKYIYEMEASLATRVHHYLYPPSILDIPIPNISSMICDYERDMDITLDNAQRRILCQVLETPINLHLLTGLPGTGKSSVVKCLWHLADVLKLKTITCAPTGKAANRLGSQASTIHRALGVIYNEDEDHFTFQRNEEQPLEADLVIVDEVSMLDLDLACQLFKALPNTCRVLLIGDENQLPPVKYGAVLHAFLDANIIPHTHLTKIFRQGEGSVISQIAQSILEGDPQTTKQLLSNTLTKEVQFMKLSDPMKLHRRILELYLKHSKSNTKPQAVAILIPTKKGDTGTVSVNSTIHRYLWKEDANDKTLLFRPHEKILVVTNSYVKDEDGEIIPEQSVFNGESGRFIEYKNKSTVTIAIEDREVTVEKDAIEMGYAATVHKQQGSEYDTIVLVLHESHSIMLNREVLYTGVTRAKKRLYILGTESCIERALKYHCPKRHNRLTRLLVRESI